MVTAKEKSILGRCTEQVYLPYIRNGYKGTPPTLQDFYQMCIRDRGSRDGRACGNHRFS